MTHGGGITQAELARNLELHLSAGFDRSKVQKMLAGLRDMSAEEMLAIEAITGFPAPVAANDDLILVPLIDWNDAEALQNPVAKAKAKNMQRHFLSDSSKGDFFATRVEDDSMDRISPVGSTILVDRADRELQDGKCYLFSLGGVVAYRMYRAEKVPHIAPYTLNMDHQPALLDDSTLVIGRVRRSILDL